MIAYKFLRAGAVSPFARHPWPVPAADEGEWVEAADPRMCEAAVHACGVAELPLWIDTELWWVELDGVVETGHDKIAAKRGRLVRRVDAWTPAVAAEYAAACAARTRELAAAEPAVAAYALDAAKYARLAAAEPARAAGCAATAAYVAVAAAAQMGGAGAACHERAWQAAWLARRLGLPYEPEA